MACADARPDAVPVEDPPSPATMFEASAGTAGASASREHLRRSNKRETRIREAHPLLGGLILAVSDDPQSTRAWKSGAQGEEAVGRRLDGLVGDGVRVLHDRRIPRSKANIDHMVVSHAGVFVIDAKRYKGKRPSLRVEGGIIRPCTEKLIVGSSDKTSLVAGVQGQMEHVRRALDAAGQSGVRITGMLCFVDGDWPLFARDFAVQGVRVLWPARLDNFVRGSDDVNPSRVDEVFRTLAEAFHSA